MQWVSACECCGASGGVKCRQQRHDSGLSLRQDSDVSLYSSSSLELVPPSLHDEASRDSGYEGKFYSFTQSLGVAPQQDYSPDKHAFDSIAEEFVELPNVELPTDFSDLISKPLNYPACSQSHTPLRRCASFNAVSPEDPCFKRPNNKPMKRSLSVSEESIDHALQRSTCEPDLIGDFSKSFCLPLIPGRHQDLKSIGSTTLASLLRGEFNSVVDSYQIIDCRYPYEFDGGHVRGAINLYLREQVLELLNETLPVSSMARRILVFHCEFSSERGPKLCRMLRNVDRMRNKDAYPALHYPEMYVLDGGYKKFFEEYSELCEPKGYRPMLHPEHQTELRYFKGKMKVCGEDRVRSRKRTSSKRNLEFW